MELKLILSRLGVAVLTEIIGRDKVSVFDALGLDINSNTLAEALIVEHGANIFRNKKLRLFIALQVAKDKIEVTFSCPINDEADIESTVDFIWGDNKKSKLFLLMIGLEADDFLVDKNLNLDAVVGGLVVPDQPLHLYQDWVRRKILLNINQQNNNRAIVHMPTGAGKTRVAMETLADFFRHSDKPDSCAVWLAHSEELCEQACGAFQSVWSRLGPSDCNIVRLWGGQKNEMLPDTNNLVVTSFQTLYQMIRTPQDIRFSFFLEIKHRCNLLIVDEAHQSIAPTYKNAIEFVSNTNTKILGLTATPGREGVDQQGDQNRELADFYHQNKITIVGNDGAPLERPIRFLQENEFLSDYEVKIIKGGEVELSEKERNEMSGLLDIPKSVLKILSADHSRTARVAAASLELTINRKLQTILFAPTKNSAIELAVYLRLNECPAAAITGDTPSMDRMRYIKDFKDGKIKILTNFGVLTAGFDAPNTEAVIIARPTLSVVLFSQMVGRGLRGIKMGGTRNCLIVNVQDNILNMPEIDDAFNFFDDFYERKV